MRRSEYDVYVCYGQQGRQPIGESLVAGLARRGFRVLAPRRGPTPSKAVPGDAADEGPQDVVLVLTRGALDPEPGGCLGEVRAAARAGKNIVLVEVVGEAAILPDDLAPLLRGRRVTFDPARLAESVALVAHRLSSDSSVDERRLMRFAKRLFLAAAIVLVAGVALQEIPILIERWSRPALLAPVPPYTLYWSALAQRVEGGRRVAVPLAKDSVVRPGDQISVTFAPSADGYAYVIGRDLQGNVNVLFPSDALKDASRVKAGVLYDAPVEGGWLTVDEGAGLEAIYIIAGYDPLQNLEELTEEPESRTTASARRELLETTVHGLLDGRHGAAERRVWTGKLHPIDESLSPHGAPAAKSAITLADGHVVDRILSAQRGLVSASVELRLKFLPR